MLFIKFGLAFCMLSVIIGAFGAHSLENIIGDKIETFKTGVQHQMFHGLGLILIGILSKVFETLVINEIEVISEKVLFISV